MLTVNFENFNQKIFIKEVRKFMEENGISMREWARLTDGSLATLQRYEKGVNEISITIAARYQKVMRTFKSADASH